MDDETGHNEPCYLECLPRTVKSKEEKRETSSRVDKTIHNIESSSNTFVYLHPQPTGSKQQKDGLQQEEQGACKPNLPLDPRWYH